MEFASYTKHRKSQEPFINKARKSNSRNEFGEYIIKQAKRAMYFL